MKKLLLSILSLLLPMLASAYDIAVENEDGKTVYYNYINDGAELEVTCKSSYSSDRYSGDVNIPEEVTYMSRTRKVTSIGESAFESCIGLTSVTIPNSVTTIGDKAFRYCTGLTSVHITDIVAWCKISFDYDYGYSNPLSYAHHLFLNGEEIKDLVIPNSVTTIEQCAFQGCSGLTSVTIPNSVKSIGMIAFANCASLTSVTIPNSVTTIGDGVFEHCTGLTSVTIGNSVTTIGQSAFYECTNLTSVTIPNSVTTIGRSAFYRCYALTSATIPNSVTTIGNRAFSGCRVLTSVISKMETPCSIDADCFDQDVFYNATLYVPEGTTEKYKSTDYWSKFLFIEEGEPGGSVTPDPKKCATPTISYANKEIAFSCDTEGVEYHYTITDTDIKSDVAGRISLSATYEISVYVTKSGYNNSDVATAILVWTSAEFTETTPAGSSVKAPTESIPVLISSRDGNLLVKSEMEGQSVSVYTLDGKALGSSKVKGGQAIIATNLPKGTIVVVKVGERSVKIAI